jgi:hypothetical protein
MKAIELIPVGNRWAYLQSKAGTLHNAGLDRDDIYKALKNFAANCVEDGANYPDDKLQALADWIVGPFPREWRGLWDGQPMFFPESKEKTAWREARAWNSFCREERAAQGVR